MTMNTERALNDHFAATGLLPEGCTRADWYAHHAIPLKIGGVTVGVFPILQREGPIILHDLHHMLTGCPPDWRGEVELAGWELASGGCGWHLFYWLDRLSLMALGLLTAPTRLLQGLRAGWGRSNLYGMSPKGVLRLDADALRRYVAV
jgi:hypothetical protein